MRRVLLIRELGRSGDEAYARERNFHAFQSVRAYLEDLEARCQDDDLFRDAVTVTLESHRDQLAMLVRGYDRARRTRSNGAGDGAP